MLRSVQVTDYGDTEVRNDDAAANLRGGIHEVLEADLGRRRFGRRVHSADVHLHRQQPRAHGLAG